MPVGWNRGLRGKCSLNGFENDMDCLSAAESRHRAVAQLIYVGQIKTPLMKSCLISNPGRLYLQLVTIDLSPATFKSSKDS